MISCEIEWVEMLIGLIDVEEFSSIRFTYMASFCAIVIETPSASNGSGSR